MTEYTEGNRTMNTVNFAREYLELCKKYRRQLISGGTLGMIIICMSEDSSIDDESFLSLREQR